ncbi:glycosyltransferase family 4 protein [Microbacterium phyllosphaerae]|uniref:glycosyltransferase family 4 protein n=1 Tax=Microbacterium phyllosphaerae TaxID=124798 RepID=UPI0021696D5E|nr:glycosyltransferase family 4 protein [Microbacterium phyllosphaerae]MCS3442172.1 glycosyltransferase involved in cell wall biosynthesis [Microbacterium phyllosphaerae]
MNVALVCDYSLNYMGGAQSVFLDEAELFRNAGERVLVVAPQSGGAPLHPALRSSTALIPTLGAIPGARLPVVLNSKSLRRRLRRLFREHRIDIVHIHSEFGLTAAAAAVAHELGIPVVHTVHTFYWSAPRLGPLDRVAGAVIRGVAGLVRGAKLRAEAEADTAVDAALRSVTLEASLNATRVISPSAHQGRALAAAGVKDAAVIANPARAGRTRKSVPLTTVDGPLCILWVGRVAPEKRLLEFLEAVERAGVAVGAGTIEVTVVGDGPLLADAKKAARTVAQRTGNRVRFTGRVDRNEVSRLMGKSHLVALTSHGFDNQPVVVVEAFDVARSVLYVDPRLEEGLAEAGILCSGPDVGGMATTLIELVREPSIVIHRSAQTVAASRRFAPENHLAQVRTVWASAVADAAVV